MATRIRKKTLSRQMPRSKAPLARELAELGNAIGNSKLLALAPKVAALEPRIAAWDAFMRAVEPFMRAVGREGGYSEDGAS